MNFTPHLVIGIGITMAGIALTLERFGVVNAESLIRLWPVLLVLYGASVVAQAFRPPNPSAPRARQGSAPLVWISIVIIAMLFSRASERRPAAARGNSDESVSTFAVLGGDNRTSYAKQFRKGEMTSFMGGSRLDLRQATIPPGEEAVIDVFAMMGGVIINVPSDWIVDVEAVSVMGGVKDERFGFSPRPRRRERDRIVAEAEPPGVNQGTTPAPPEATPPAEAPPAPAEEAAGPAPRLVVRGFVMMGGLIIRS